MAFANARKCYARFRVPRLVKKNRNLGIQISRSQEYPSTLKHHNFLSVVKVHIYHSRLYVASSTIIAYSNTMLFLKINVYESNREFQRDAFG